jgi:hypothetical protein
LISVHDVVHELSWETDGDSDTRRRTGSIRQRGNTLQVRLFEGRDSATGRDVYLTATVKGTDKAAHKEADAKLAAFWTEVRKQRSAQSSVSFGYVLDQWLSTNELAESTCHTYEGYIARTIRPVLGDLPARKVDARTLESLYNELRRCSARCDGTPYIEKHKKTEEHDCKTEKCRAHKCKGMASSTVDRYTQSSAAHWTRPNDGAGSDRTPPESPRSPSRSDQSRTRRRQQKPPV